MEVIVTEVKAETPLRRARVSLVRLAARLLRVPIRIRDDFYGASADEISADFPSATP
jgi:hypothetical protein